MSDNIKQVSARPSGYYWVKFENEDVIAYFDGQVQRWYMIGTNKVYYHRELKFISQKRLERQ